MDLKNDPRALEIAIRASKLDTKKRERLLNDECADDARLREQVEDILAVQGTTEALGGSAEPLGISRGAENTGELVRRLADRQQRLEPDLRRYRLAGELARGGQGAILRVWDEDLQRSLAMKVVLGRAGDGADSRMGESTPVDRLSAVDPLSLGRFVDEAQVTGQLDHPGIVPVHEMGLDAGGRVYFTMKLVKGRNLQEIFGLVQRGEEGWSTTRALGVLLKVCEAMAYAHAKGVIHRDLKPGNVMVGRFGEVYVMDWGLARILGQKDTKDLRIRAELPVTSELRSERRDHASDTPDSPLMTMDGDVVGTPAYMSPEQARGDLEAVGPPTDVYAVGAMLYQLLSGRMPYVIPGARVNAYALWQLVQWGPPSPIHELAGDAPPELLAICQKAMAREQSERYPDVQSLCDDLRAFIEGRVVRAHRTGALAELRSWVRRNRGTALALGSAALLLIAGLSVSLIYKSRADRLALLADQRFELAQRRADVATLQAAKMGVDRSGQLDDALMAEVSPIMARARDAIAAGAPGEDRALIDAAASFALHLEAPRVEPVLYRDRTGWDADIRFGHAGGLGPSSFVLSRGRVLVDGVWQDIDDGDAGLYCVAYYGAEDPDQRVFSRRPGCVIRTRIPPLPGGQHTIQIEVMAALYEGSPYSYPGLELGAGDDEWIDDEPPSGSPIWERQLKFGPYEVTVHEESKAAPVHDSGLAGAMQAALDPQEVTVFLDDGGDSTIAWVRAMFRTSRATWQPLPVCGELIIQVNGSRAQLSAPFYSWLTSREDWWYVGGDTWQAELGSGRDSVGRRDGKTLVSDEGWFIVWSPPIELADPTAWEESLDAEGSSFSVVIRSSTDHVELLRRNDSTASVYWVGELEYRIPGTVILGIDQISSSTRRLLGITSR